MIIKKLIFITEFILRIILLVSFIIILYLALPIRLPAHTLHIPQGSTSSIISYLGQKKIDIFKLDRFIIRYFGHIQAGWITLPTTSMSRAEFFYHLTHAKAATNSIQILPSDSSYLALQKIATKLNLSFENMYNYYLKTTPLPDGWIIAQTHNIPIQSSEKEVVDYILEYSTTIHEQLLAKYKINEMKKYYKILIIASIIEKEAVQESEKPLISAVIHNRLKRGMKLQMDGTLNYQENSHKAVKAIQIKNDNSQFNTYKISGLPPYPVCVVSPSSVDAAVNPANVNYLYFVSNDGKTHKFSSSYAEHLKKIKKR